MQVFIFSYCPAKASVICAGPLALAKENAPIFPGMGCPLSIRAAPLWGNVAGDGALAQCCLLQLDAARSAVLPKVSQVLSLGSAGMDGG